MSLLYRKRTILAKIESVYGTDPTPTGAADAIQVRNLTITPLEGDNVERDLVRPYLGNAGQLVAAYRAAVEFEVEFAGAGAAGDVPKYGPLLRGCAMGETISAGVDVQYKPISASHESVTIYVNVDGVLHELNGARGNVDIAIVAKQIPVLRFRFVGLFVPVVDAAAPTVSYTGFQTPLTVNDTNTPTFSLHGVASAVMQSLSIDLGNNVIHRSLVNSDSVLITDRKVAGQTLIEATNVATKNWIDAVKTTALGALSLEHGTAAGNIVALSSSQVQLISPSYQEADGVAMMQFDLSFIPTSAGNDELTITVK